METIKTSVNNASRPTRGITVKNAAVATLLGLALLRPIKTCDLAHEKQQSGISKQECSQLSNLMYNSNPFTDLENTEYTKTDNVYDILLHAERAGKELNIPTEFVFAHWAMETGMLSIPNVGAIRNNNLGGIMKDRKLRSFDTLDEFTDAYVAILRKAGVDKIPDSSENKLLEIMDLLDKKKYANDEPEEKYFSKIIGVANRLKDIPEFSGFNLECQNAMEILKERNLNALKR